MKEKSSTENNKRTSLVPTRRNKKNRKDTESSLSNINTKNKIQENDNMKYSNSSYENNMYKDKVFNKDIDYINNHSLNTNNNVVEKVTIKNTTTKSIETRTPDGYYTNATQSAERLEEYTRYENKDNKKKDLYEDFIDLHPNYGGYEILDDESISTQKKQEQIPLSRNNSPLINKSKETLLLENQNSKRRDEYIEAVKENGLALQFIDKKNRDKMIEYLAVKQNGLAIQYIDEDNQNEELCISAVKQNGLAIRYVINQTYKVCKEAIKENFASFHYILDKNYNICIEAVKQNGLLLEYIKEQDDRICNEAIIQNPFALEFVLKQNDDICRKAIYGSGMSLKYVKNKTPELCILALKRNTLAMKYIPYSFLKEGLDFKDYVFVYSNKHIFVSSIKEVRGLNIIHLPTNENGYLIINALSDSKYKTSFILQKDNVYVDDNLVERLASNKHFVVLVNE